MATRDLVVVGASAGGVEALVRFVGALPEDLPATVLVVLHVPPSGSSALPTILARRARLAVRSATDGDPLVTGTVLVAPPDRHLLVGEGAVRLSTGPRENGSRPSVDVLFRSAAAAAGGRVQAVVLSGTLDDGASGAAAVRANGGLVLVQSEEDALYPSMPRATAERVGADATAGAVELAHVVAGWAGERVEAGATPGPSPATVKEVEVSADDSWEREVQQQMGPPSGFSCPDCAGVLYTVPEDPVYRFRCRVGHAWTADALTHEQDVHVESALWVALRSLEERAELSDRLAERAVADRHDFTAKHFRRSSTEARESAVLIKRLLDGVVERRGAVEVDAPMVIGGAD